MAEKLNGTEFAKIVKEQQKLRADELKKRGIIPGLGTVLVGEDPGSLKYVAGKHKDCEEVGIKSIRVDMPVTSTESEILAEVKRLNDDPECMSYIVQLPLPKGVDQNKVLQAMDPAKDADGLHPFNLGSLVLNVSDDLTTPVPCTPFGIIKLIEHYLGQGFLNGKHIVVLGRGVTVGRSIGLLLTRRDVNATVTLCHTGTKNLEDITRTADVIVAAVGVPHFVKPTMLKVPDDGEVAPVLVDVGVSRDPETGKIAGDVDPACHELASWYSPNPGGVGPMTRAMLLENVVRIAESR
jgi:methylenetetrahydrofolate dehydrogenase (NADP+)/methenyltetrahydrofolate cyclohydrolase